MAGPRLLGVFFLLVVLEGAIRKWLLPDHQELVYLAKDLLLVGLVVLYLLRYGFRLPPGLSARPIVLLFVLYACWTLFGLWSRSLPNLALGLWGIKSHLLYMSLLFLIPAAFPSVDVLFRWVERFAWLALPVLLLGVVQFFAPPDSLINAYAQDDRLDAINTFGFIPFVRVTGTFPYITGMCTYTFTALLLGLSLLLARPFDRRSVPPAAVVVLAVLVSFMTGSRWTVYIWAIVLPLLGFELLRSRLIRVSGVVRFAAVGVAAGLALLWFAGPALEAFLYRAGTAGDDEDRITMLLLQPLLFMDQAGFFGFGPGTTHQAAAALVPARALYSWLPALSFEDEPGRLVLELGFAGFLLVFLLKLGLCLLAHRTILYARNRKELALALAALGFLVAHQTTPIVFNATAGAFYWGFAGILFTILTDQIASARRRAAAGR